MRLHKVTMNNVCTPNAVRFQINANQKWTVSCSGYDPTCNKVIIIFSKQCESSRCMRKIVSKFKCNRVVGVTLSLHAHFLVCSMCMCHAIYTVSISEYAFHVLNTFEYYIFSVHQFLGANYEIKCISEYVQ